MNHIKGLPSNLWSFFLNIYICVCVLPWKKYKLWRKINSWYLKFLTILSFHGELTKEWAMQRTANKATHHQGRPPPDHQCTACHQSSKAKRRKACLSSLLEEEMKRPRRSGELTLCPAVVLRREGVWSMSLGKKETFIPEQSPSPAVARWGEEKSVHTSS